MKLISLLVLLVGAASAQPWLPTLNLTSSPMTLGNVGVIEESLSQSNPQTLYTAYLASFAIAKIGWNITGDRAEPVLYSLEKTDHLFLNTYLYGNHGKVFNGFGPSGRRLISCNPELPIPARHPRRLEIQIPAIQALAGVKFYVQGMIWDLYSPKPFAVTFPLTVEIRR